MVRSMSHQFSRVRMYLIAPITPWRRGLPLPRPTADVYLSRSCCRQSQSQYKVLGKEKWRQGAYFRSRSCFARVICSIQAGHLKRARMPIYVVDILSGQNKPPRLRVERCCAAIALLRGDFSFGTYLCEHSLVRALDSLLLDTSKSSCYKTLRFLYCE